MPRQGAAPPYDKQSALRRVRNKMDNNIEKRIQGLTDRLTYARDIFAGKHEEDIRLLEEKLAVFVGRAQRGELADPYNDVVALEELFGFVEKRLENAVTPMDKVRIVRHPQRICLRDILENVYDNFTEVGGQDEHSLDPSMLIARAVITRRRGKKTYTQSVMVIGQEKGHGAEFRNGGSVKPWGNAKALHYMNVAETEGIPVQPVSVEQLAATAAWFAQRVNETADQVPRDETGVFAVSTGEIFARAQGLYDGVSRRYPSLAGPQRSPKAAGYSYLMSLTGFTGYIFPFTGESTLNVDCPAVFLPVTVAHEFAHQRGVAPEQEANYVAVAACADSGDPVYTYSGWLFGFLHLSNALYGADPDRWAPVYASLCESAQRDMAANNAYWAAMEGPVQTAAESTYSGFLQSYGQELGMRSYGACVDLLVARWCPANLAENP